MRPGGASHGLRVLVVEDDPKFRNLLCAGLVEHGMSSVGAHHGAEALQILAGSGPRPFDVVLLDLMMPELDGWSCLERIRASGDVPVILVTARDAIEDRVRGLGIGADDYIIKPFAFDELVARLVAVTRRWRALRHLGVGGLRLDPVERRVVGNGKTLHLSPKEFSLLRCLLQHSPKPVSRAEILRVVWGIDFDPGTNVVDVHIARLRRKIESVRGVRIDPVRGIGYSVVLTERSEA